MDSRNFKKTPDNEPFIFQRADPYLYRHTDGSYYFTASVPEYDRIILRRSDTILGLKAEKEVTIWEKHGQGIMSTHIWAPELHYLDGRWYVYFAAGDVDDVWAIRPYVLECREPDPMAGPWKELGMMQSFDDYSFRDFSLDMTVFEHGGSRYCIWAEKVSVGKKISNLYIARLETPWKLSSEQVTLSTPDYDWERVGFWVNEGPAVLKHGNKIYVTYSASSTGACYCMGMLSIDADADLLDRNAWKKERKPIFKTVPEKGIFGPGHNCFVKSEDGLKDIMVYHARQYDEITGDPLYDPNRHAYLMEVGWGDHGPLFDWKNRIG
ncbi:glycoside hydrolase family 43 protein [Clostridium sp. Marseille-P2415]|uniref:glycoside hydrolase family 43 protein n=1 Tax=Clostridium sp. Marseille-P2415 TaxID=1805471 RepID=UPI0009889297|nr:family 43 glycosylhydrolase [Clostridium sp. Marseille-P2415]